MIEKNIEKYLQLFQKKMNDNDYPEESKKEIIDSFFTFVFFVLPQLINQILTGEEQAFVKTKQPNNLDEYKNILNELVNTFPTVKERIQSETSVGFFEKKLQQFYRDVFQEEPIFP